MGDTEHAGSSRSKSNHESRGARRGRWPLLGAAAWFGILAALAVALIATAGERWDGPGSTLGAGGAGAESDGLIAVRLLGFMCSTFAYHAGLAALAAAAFAVLARRWRLLAVGMVAFVLGAGPEVAAGLAGMARSGDGPAARSAPGSVSRLKVMSVNLMYGRTDAEALLALVALEAPDVLVFQEWTPRAAEELSSRLGGEQGMPHSIERAQDDAFGQAVFSRRPFTEPPRAYPPTGSFSDPQISVAVQHDGQALRITNIHLLPPIGVAFHREQRAAAQSLAAWVAATAGEPEAGPPDVLIGDFNAVARSAVMRRLRAAGLRDAHSEGGAWRGSTWPRRGNLRFAPGVRIDHAMVGPRVRCVSSRTCDDVGSDHRPIVAELMWSGR